MSSRHTLSITTISITTLLVFTIGILLFYSGDLSVRAASVEKAAPQENQELPDSESDQPDSPTENSAASNTNDSLDTPLKMDDVLAQAGIPDEVSEAEAEDVVEREQAKATAEPKLEATDITEETSEPSSEATAEAQQPDITAEPLPEVTEEAEQPDSAANPLPETTDEPRLEATDINPESTEEISSEVTVEATEQVIGLDASQLLAVAAGEPDIELSVACPQPNTARFTLRNSGGDMLNSGTYTVSDPAAENSFQLSEGESLSFEAAGDAIVEVRYSTLSLESVFLSATGQCTPRPTPTVTPTITPTPGATFTPSNTPFPSDTPTVTLTPTITLTPSATFTPSVTFTPSSTFTPTITPTPSLTFTPSNTPLPTNTPTITLTPSITFTPTITPTPSATPSSPEIELSVACLPTIEDGVIQARFRLRNVGGNMLSPGTYTVAEPGNTPETQEFLLGEGEILDFIAAGNADVQAAYTTLTLNSVFLSVTGTCTFGSQATPTPTPTRRPVPTRTPSDDTSEPDESSGPTDVPIEEPLSTQSADQIVPTSVPPTPIPPTQPMLEPNASIVCGDISETDENGFPEIDMSTCIPDTTIVERESWTSISVGEAVCPDWLVYHTNMTGDWEIFRLGELPDGLEGDSNLSRGIGTRVYDLMPSRSPDQMWVTFTSNRDGNWEVYISAVTEDFIQRVTYNTSAVDLDPVWSSTDGRLVYESNRDGNWNLYLFDVDDGSETRLTHSTGNDINAAWSQDGTRIVFQSDREGFWQIYELDLSTLQEQLLSDGVGDDHAPQYSSNDAHIAFRSFRDGENSTIYVMSAEGSDVTLISDAVGYASSHAWSPDSDLIAYQSNLDGDNDIYVYDTNTQVTRLITDNPVEDYAPTWVCDAPMLVFTSDVTEDSNLFSTSALPIKAPAIRVEEEASQLTFDPESDQYPLNSPSEENASRQESFPSAVKNK